MAKLWFARTTLRSRVEGEGGSIERVATRAPTELFFDQPTAGRSLNYWQMDFKRGSLAWFALYVYPTAMVFDDPMANR